MPFQWSLNPYGSCAHRCAFCYVRAYEIRAERPADARFGTSIRVKTNVVEVLQAELARRSWRRELVAIGTATDPYQPAEGSYKLTRECLQALAEARTPASIVTRGPLIVRDIDVLRELGRVAGVSVAVSIPTLDTQVWRTMEPGTAPPRQRLRALAQLCAAGVDAGVAVAPMLPGLTDGCDTLAAVLRAAREAGATFAWTSPLRLPPGTREFFLAELARCWPELVAKYEHWYRGPYLARARSEKCTRRAAAIAAEFGLSTRRGTVEAKGKPVQLTLWES